MSDQTNDTNKRIAEASGLFDLYLKPQIQGDDILHCFSKTPRTGFYRWMGSDIFHGPVPNYTESLDAMAEAEKAAGFHDVSSKGTELRRKYIRNLNRSDGLSAWGFATAAQRAAAFLAVVEGRGE